MRQPDWAPEEIDIDTPSVARAYDYLLGGSHNFAVDREFSRRLLAVVPDGRLVAQANRAFMHRAVRFMVGAGVRQFLDIGSGIPTLGNVHEIAQKAAPDARVVYVDVEPVAVAHSQQILAGNPGAVIIQEDLRRPREILTHPQTRTLLDFDKPVGLLLIAILHAVPDQDDPVTLVRTLLDALPSGSYLAISHGTGDSRPAEVGEAQRLAAKTTTPVTIRDQAQVRQFFTGLEFVEPGLVWASQWRPDSPGDTEGAERTSLYVGVGRKP